jgi:isopenicillin-N N-acyltransferase-like protein
MYELKFHMGHLMMDARAFHGRERERVCWARIGIGISSRSSLYLGFCSQLTYIYIKSQAPNLLRVNIKKQDESSLQMIAEAGILGKIGLNSHGVGCTLNAITANGVSYNKLPCHLALRTILESTSRSAATIQTLEEEGVASSCQLLVGDVTGGTGLECSSENIVRLEMDPEGLIMHTNHYILLNNEKVAESKNLLPDTWYRLRRIGELVDAVKEEGPSIKVVERLFLDEVEGDGSSICRHYQDTDGLATLFRIVMDLGEERATVSVGLPVDPVENFELSP